MALPSDVRSFLCRLPELTGLWCRFLLAPRVGRSCVCAEAVLFLRIQAVVLRVLPLPKPRLRGRSLLCLCSRERLR